MKKKIQAIALCAVAALFLWTTTAEAIGMGGRFNRGVRRRATKTTTYIIPRVVEVWFGKLHTPAYNSGVCNDDDYVETTQLYTRRTDTASTITYNGTGCTVDPTLSTHNHLALAPGTYKLTMTSSGLAAGMTANCSYWLYGSVDSLDGDELVNSVSSFSSHVGGQGSSVYLIVAAGTVHNLVPWTNACTSADASVQSFIMIERLLV